jgi:hypothetical protein
MTEDFTTTFARLRDLGLRRKRLGLTPEQVLAAVERWRDEMASGEDRTTILSLPEPPLGEALSLHLGLAAADTTPSRQEIDFGDKDLIGRLDTSRNRVSLEHKKLAPGTLLYVGFVAAGAENADGCHRTCTTPFNRVFHAALAHADSFERATALAGIAARLGWCEIKESLLAEAVRSARLTADRSHRSEALAIIASQYPEERRPDYLEEAGRTEALAAPPVPEPAFADGRHFGRYVMLRSGLRHAGAYLSAGAYLHWPHTPWRAFVKVIHFAAEAEVAPQLLCLSVQEAVNYDPNSAPLWRAWLTAHLPEARRADLLAMLESPP